MKLFFAFSRAYPAQSALALGSLLLASLIEGIGLVTMLPLLATQSPDMAARLPKGLTARDATGAGLRWPHPDGRACCS